MWYARIPAQNIEVFDTTERKALIKLGRAIGVSYGRIKRAVNRAGRAGQYARHRGHSLFATPWGEIEFGPCKKGRSGECWIVPAWGHFADEQEPLEMHILDFESNLTKAMDSFKRYCVNKGGPCRLTRRALLRALEEVEQVEWHNKQLGGFGGRGDVELTKYPKKAYEAWPAVTYHGHLILREVYKHQSQLWDRVHIKYGEEYDLDGQECYLGYIPKLDQFVMGWDVWSYGEYGESFGWAYVRFTVSRDTRRATVVDVQYDLSDEGFYGRAAGHTQIHKEFPKIVDLRLD